MSLTLTVLGTASPHPRPDTPCSGYLVRGGGVEVWVDAGFGTFAELQRHTDPTGLSAIWISHLHADHYADLTAAFYGFAYGGLTLPAPIPVYAPRDCAQRLAGFFGRPDPGFLSEVFDFRPLHNGHTVRHGDLTLTARGVEHDVEAYGLWAESGGRALAYSGDTGPCDQLLHLASGADLFLCEADKAEAGRKREEDPVHLTPGEAGAGALLAGGVGKLLITHLGTTNTPDGAVAEAASAFDGPVSAARVGETCTV